MNKVSRKNKSLRLRGRGPENLVHEREKRTLFDFCRRLPCFSLARQGSRRMRRWSRPREIKKADLEKSHANRSVIRHVWVVDPRRLAHREPRVEMSANTIHDALRVESRACACRPRGKEKPRGAKEKTHKFDLSLRTKETQGRHDSQRAPSRCHTMLADDRCMGFAFWADATKETVLKRSRLGAGRLTVGDLNGYSTGNVMSIPNLPP